MKRIQFKLSMPNRGADVLRDSEGNLFLGDLDSPLTEQGNCIDCGAVIKQPAGSGRRRKRCEVCVKSRASHYAIKWKATKAAEGKCIACGKDKEEAGLKCRLCARKHVATVLRSQERRKAEGRCKCGGVPQEGYVYCHKCLQYHRQWREKNKLLPAAR
jgi:hypothetical protein